jgi:energy-coupling factor transporter ATP-binding protein EcfA2
MLDSLLIKNFRSLEHLEVRKLGRVNLIVGKNNSGKSTVLEALRIYAGNAQRPLLEAIAREHNERYKVEEQVSLDDDTMLPFQDFFTGRSFSIDGTKAIEVGEIGNPSSLLVIKYALLEQIEVEVDDEEEGAVSRVRRRLLTPAEAIDSEAELQPVFSLKKGDRNRPLMKLTGSIVTSRMMFDSLHAQPCSVIPTNFISMDELADEWDTIVLTDQEEIVKRALRIISPDFESLVFVRDDGASDCNGQAQGHATACSSQQPGRRHVAGVADFIEAVWCQRRIFPDRRV